VILTLEIGQVPLLIERRRLETERVHNVVDLDGLVLDALLGLLGGGVGTSVCSSITCQRDFACLPGHRSGAQSILARRLEADERAS
jgi:hypothetical protein